MQFYSGKKTTWCYKKRFRLLQAIAPSNLTAAPELKPYIHQFFLDFE